MTYRDDRDATLARADALQEDLKRAEAERDRLRAEVEKLESERDAPPTPAPVETIVTTRTQALTPREVDFLLSFVEIGLGRTRSEVPVGQSIAAVLLVGSVPLYVFVSPFYAAMAMAMGLVATVIAVIARATGTNDDTAVLAAVRDRPGDVLELVETKHGITIVTRARSARCSADDRAELLVQLAKHCPNARVRGG